MGRTNTRHWKSHPLNSGSYNRSGDLGTEQYDTRPCGVAVSSLQKRSPLHTHLSYLGDPRSKDQRVDFNPAGPCQNL